MKVNEFKDKSAAELQEALVTQLQDQFKLKMQAATGQLNQTHLLRQSRRDIARIKTLLKQKAEA